MKKKYKVGDYIVFYATSWQKNCLGRIVEIDAVGHYFQIKYTGNDKVVYDGYISTPDRLARPEEIIGARLMGFNL